MRTKEDEISLKIAELRGSCKRCFYCNPVVSAGKTGDDVVTGECRYNEPRTQLIPVPAGLSNQISLQNLSFYPVIPDLSAGWCGRFEDAEDMVKIMQGNGEEE
jgi:hypothetical protein